MWVLENTEGEVRRRLDMGRPGVEMDPDMVHRGYSDTLRFKWQREVPRGTAFREAGNWESERVPIVIEEQSWDFTGRLEVIGLLDEEAALREWGEVLAEAEALTQEGVEVAILAYSDGSKKGSLGSQTGTYGWEIRGVEGGDGEETHQRRGGGPR